MPFTAFLIAATVLAVTPGPGIAYVVARTGAAQGARRALLGGVVVEALNVKTALFFLAFLPQFVAPAEPLVPQLVLLGSICVALNTLVDVVAVLAAQKL